MDWELLCHGLAMLWPVACQELRQICRANELLAVGCAEAEAQGKSTFTECGMIFVFEGEALVQFHLAFW